MPDRFLGKYVSLGYLGHGSMGHVWLAHPEGEPDRRVVVKFMHPSAARQPHFREMFQREIRSMTELSHPYIVKLLDASAPRDPKPCLAMEYVPGITLEKYLEKNGRLRVGHVGLLLGQLCHALEAAHDQGIVHQDLKPANLMVVNAGSLDESLRVMDFGLARVDTRPHISADRLLGKSVVSAVGSPGYVSPEALRGDTVDARTDLYSVGAMLFLMLTGHTPFKQIVPRQLLRAHLEEQPRTFASVGIRDVLPSVESVVLQCLSKYPAERPGSARELAAVFSKVIGVDIWEAGRPDAPVPPKRPSDSKIPVPDRRTIVHQIDAYMPEGIAVVKLRGFLEDMGGRVLASEPGRMRLQIGGLGTRKGAASDSHPPTVPQLPVEIELQMEKPDPRDNRLTVIVLIRPFTDPLHLKGQDWRGRCQYLLQELQSYLMAV